MFGLVGVAWDYILSYFGHDEFTTVIVATNAWLIGLFWFTCFFYLFVDVTGWPKSVLIYKVQPGHNEPVETKKLINAIFTVLINQFIIDLPMTMLFHSWFGTPWQTSELPNIFIFARDFIIFMLMDEVIFYYSHRLLHWGPLYKKIHKKHHEWTAPIGLVAHYAHPLEHIFSNSSPLLLMGFLLRSHLITRWIWYTLFLVSTVSHHSGYHLPLMPSPEFHDYHHMTFNHNFGSMGVLDNFHGTSKPYKDSKYEKRHQTLYSLKPIRYFFPD